MNEIKKKKKKKKRRTYTPEEFKRYEKFLAIYLVCLIIPVIPIVLLQDYCVYSDVIAFFDQALIKFGNAIFILPIFLYVLGILFGAFVGIDIGPKSR